MNVSCWGCPKIAYNVLRLGEEAETDANLEHEC